MLWLETKAFQGAEEWFKYTSLSLLEMFVFFLLLVLVFLLVILIQEEIDLWSAIGFSSMYVVYVIAQECKCFLVLEDQRAQGFLFYSYFL